MITRKNQNARRKSIETGTLTFCNRSLENSVPESSKNKLLLSSRQKISFKAEMKQISGSRMSVSEGEQGVLRLVFFLF